MAVFSAITLMMEAASSCETSANYYQTIWRKNPEDSGLHTRRRENLKSHFCISVILTKLQPCPTLPPPPQKAM
jgi:hypothetical protein